MLTKVLQANVNRSKPSLDLLIHQAKESGTGLLSVSEPNYVPNTNNWYTSEDKSAVIFTDPNYIKMRCQIAKRGSRFIALQCGTYLIISVYAPPSLGLREFNSFLDELSDALSYRVDKIILGGDFNAKANLWGSNNTNGKGLVLTRWAAERDLRITNTGNTPTCVRPQGSSIVDLTWTSPDLVQLVRDWRVREDLESLSDHLYISYSIHTDRPSLPLNRITFRKWNGKRFDRDFFLAVMVWRGIGPKVEDRDNVERITIWLDQTMEEACDAAADRIGPRRPRRHAYWWQDSVAAIRHQCIRARRQWQRAKKRKWPHMNIDELGKEYKLRRKELRKEINRLKSLAWQELIDSIDKGPWGLPYRIVLKKLRAASPGITELLELETLAKLLDSLFPRRELADPIRDWSDFAWSDEWSIALSEVNRVIRKVSTSPTKAPGPDGFRLITWKGVTEEILEWIRYLFDSCLKKGEFPASWKRAN